MAPSESDIPAPDGPPVRLRPVDPLTPEALDRAGWGWLYAADAARARESYLAPEMVVVSEPEAEALYLAGNELYAMVVDAAEAVIEGGRLAEIGIPERMHRLVRHTWEDDRHWHLWGRFDLAGGLGGRPIELIEFNADTATSIPETAVLQWAQAGAAGLDERDQYNQLYERLVEGFGRLKSKNDDLQPTLLCTGYADAPEDDANLAVLGAAAEEAGFRVTHRAIPDVTFAAGEGVFTYEEAAEGREAGWVRHDFVVKLVPWEQLVLDEPEFYDTLESLILDRHTVVVNPAYSLVFQSKRLLKVLWERNPGHPLLLPADYAPLSGRRYAEKVAFGREGANVTLYAPNGEALLKTEGDYDVFPAVYQAWADLPHDDQARLYQTGLFWSFEACALGFRRGGLVLDDQSAFVGHVVEG